MTAAATFAPRALPAETDDPREALLDLFEGQVRTLIAHGLEAPMRARLARLLSPDAAPVAAQVETVGQASGPAVPGPDAGLEVAQILTALGYAARARLTEPEHRCVQAARVLVAKHLGNLLAATTGGRR